MENLKELSKKIYEANKEKGFWDKERNFGEVIALCHCELSEAFEEYRKKENLPNGGMYYYSDKNGNLFEKNDETNSLKPEGMASEMIDVIIRVLDWCGNQDLDVDALIDEKLAYNKTRPYKHNKNC